ncbi:hypothetical protein [Rickettsiales endosymbiont of Stachyamoeba lipophora]|uniref:hypothetical protein n=1 Tax=Rickettsiales endosymbiont of Stachyamoeba lipophora TaxID=2486578 RepID=UPI000F652947|nr:hypothetical protein [Rickettsiales endosymbiont of Stachyamoeba lipophora]AZL15929.1 hypothetical protein EF513_05160 [Rickettsiales endosymbiont of Stachyamoeba lipophora]
MSFFMNYHKPKVQSDSSKKTAATLSLIKKIQDFLLLNTNLDEIFNIDNDSLAQFAEYITTMYEEEYEELILDHKKLFDLISDKQDQLIENLLSKKSVMDGLQSSEINDRISNNKIFNQLTTPHQVKVFAQVASFIYKNNLQVIRHEE